MSQDSSFSRREKVLKFLSSCSEPVSASSLAKKFQVSRQVIVGDIALLRASGSDIFATPKGYLCNENKEVASPFGFIGMVACKHYEDNLAEELYTVVDYGGTVIDVIIEHSVYGEISGPLDINCRLDADDFMKNLKENKSKPLSNLTDGIHLHNIGCKNKETFQLICEALKSKGIALE